MLIKLELDHENLMLIALKRQLSQEKVYELLLLLSFLIAIFHCAIGNLLSVECLWGMTNLTAKVEIYDGTFEECP